MKGLFDPLLIRPSSSHYLTGSYRIYSDRRSKVSSCCKCIICIGSHYDPEGSDMKLRPRFPLPYALPHIVIIDVKFYITFAFSCNIYVPPPRV